MSNTKELRLRYEAKKKEIEHRIAELRADTESRSNDELQKLEKQLDELKSTASEKFDSLSQQAAGAINGLLDRLEGKN